MTESQLAALLRSRRTLTQAEVDKRTARHDAHDLRPTERLAQYGK